MIDNFGETFLWQIDLEYKSELIFKDEVFQIIGSAIEVHMQLGNGFLEGVYQEGL